MSTTDEDDLQTLDEWSDLDEGEEEGSVVHGVGPPTIHLGDLTPEQAKRALSHTSADRSTLRTSTTAPPEAPQNKFVQMLARLNASMASDATLKRCIQADENMVKLQKVITDSQLPASFATPWLQEERRVYAQASESIDGRPKTLKRRAVKSIMLHRALTSILRMQRNGDWPSTLGNEFETTVVAYLTGIMKG